MGEIPPLALGIAISPVPMIAVILMLLAPSARATSLGFLLGWFFGVVVAVALFVVLASALGLGGASGPSSLVSRVKLVLGAALVGLGLRQWRARPAAGEVAVLPSWMAAMRPSRP